MAKYIEKIPVVLRWVLFVPITYVAYKFAWLVGTIVLGYLTAPLFFLASDSISKRTFAQIIGVLIFIIVAIIGSWICIKFAPKYKWGCLIALNFIYLIWLLVSLPLNQIYLLLIVIPSSLFTGYFMLYKESR